MERGQMDGEMRLRMRVYQQGRGTLGTIDRHQLQFRTSYTATVSGLIAYLTYTLLTTEQVSGYEVSIYSAYPVTFWVVYFVLYVLAVAPILYGAKGKSVLLLAVAALVLPYISILLLPLFRGYFCVDSGDAIAHLTYVKHLINHGQFGLGSGIQDPYPLPHLLAAGLSLVGVRLEATIQIVPMLYYCWFVAFSYLLARELFKDNRKALLILPIVLLPALNGGYFYPSQLFLFMLPSLFYFALRRNWFATVAVIILLPITHPASPILFASLLAVLGIALYLTGSRPRLNAYWFLIAVFAFVWFFWLNIIQSQALSIVSSYPRELTGAQRPETIIESILQGLSLARLNIGGFVALYLKRYGALHFVMGLGLAFSIIINYRWARHKSDGKLVRILALACPIYTALYILSFFTPEALLLRRIYPYAVLATLLPAVLLVDKLVAARRMGAVTALLAVLLVVNFLGVFNLYDSPFNKKPSQQCTWNEVSALGWFLENRDEGLKLYDLGHQQSAIARFIYGSANPSGEANLDERGLPKHFGYDKGLPLGETMGEDCYLLVNERYIRISQEVYPEYEDIWDYHPNDYERLYRDPSVELLYDRNGIKIFHIKGEAKE